MSATRTPAPPPLKRYRARVEGGGYCRKTLSLPAELVRRIEAHLAANPGLTMSAFVSDEIDRVLAPPKRS
jgi:hypothetical protein